MVKVPGAVCHAREHASLPPWEDEGASLLKREQQPGQDAAMLDAVCPTPPPRVFT